MSVDKQEYRGFTLCVTARKDHEDLWAFEYHLEKDGEPLSPRIGVTRSQTMEAHQSAEIAVLAGLEVAKIEVDNLLALH